VNQKDDTDIDFEKSLSESKFLEMLWNEKRVAVFGTDASF